jgi:tetratricopeptide (TPR) repeat protein
MSFSIEPKGPDVAEVALRWDRLKVAFPITVDVPGLVWKDILDELAEADADGEDYLLAASYSLQQGGHREEALGWADRAVALKPGFWTYETKARLLHREGRIAEALPFLEQAIADAQGKTPQAYLDGLLKTRDEWSAPPRR